MIRSAMGDPKKVADHLTEGICGDLAVWQVASVCNANARIFELGFQLFKDSDCVFRRLCPTAQVPITSHGTLAGSHLPKPQAAIL